MTSKEIGLEEARKSLGDLVNASLFADTTTVITRNGKPAARIAPLPAYEPEVPFFTESQRKQRSEDVAAIRDAVRRQDLDLDTVEDISRHVDTELLEKHFPWLEIFRNTQYREQEKLDEAAGDFDPVMPVFAPDPDGRVQMWKDAYDAAVKAILKSDLW